MTRRLSLLLALACALALPASAANIHIEADTYYTNGGIRGCGDAIARVSCDGASEGVAVEGVDCAAEWIAIELPIPSESCFYIGLESARYLGLVTHFRVEVRTDDAHQSLVAADSLVTSPGLGAT